MRKEIKLIAFDLDGTFLDDEKKIPEKNIQAMRAAAERGIICVPATGRLARGIARPIFELPGLRYILASNGASLYDIKTKQAVYKATLDLKTALRLCDYMEKLPVTYGCFQFERGYMIRAGYERLSEYMGHAPAMLEYVRRVNYPVDSLREMLQKRGQPVEKMLMFYRPEDNDLRLEQLELMPRVFPELKISSSVSNNTEINASEADKWLAISALCAQLGIDPESTVCFGDASNDAPMLRGAGLGIAMRNGNEAAKSVADMVTDLDNNNGGVGDMIMKLIG